MVSVAARVASFYWQFTGVLNQDVPLDDDGKPTEFARYVGYFVERKPHFQGELSLPLQRMIVAAYLEALEEGEEPRAFIRKASYAAARLARRSKPLAGSTLESRARASTATPTKPEDPVYELRDIVEAALLEHGLPLLNHLLDATLRGVAERGGTLRQRLQVGATADAVSKTDLLRWLAALDRYLVSKTAGRETDRCLERLRAASIPLLEPDPLSAPVARLRDRSEAVLDAAGAWLRLARTTPGRAARELIREIRALPRLIPSAAFLIANAALFAWIVGTALTEIDTAWGAAAGVASVFVSLWVTDAFTYAVHLERDGWGDSTVARAFQDHHDVPDEVGLWTVRRSVGTTGMMILIPMVLLALAQPHFVLAIGAALFLLGILFATQTHRWAHAPPESIPRWVTGLQKLRLMISAEAHAVHHDNLDRSWGIFNGWSNRVLDRLGYHQKYTRLRARLFGEVRPLWESQLVARAAARDRQRHGPSLDVGAGA